MKQKLSTHKRGSFMLPENLSGSLVNDLHKLLETGSGPKVDYLSKHMLSKYADPDPRLADERRKSAIAKWLRTEQRNERTNDRLYRNQCITWFRDGKTTHDLIDRCRRIVASVIGHRVPYHLLGGGFSGGASTSKRRQPGMVGRKFSGKQDVTRSAWTYMLPIILGSVWRNSPGSLEPDFTSSSVLFTVPKSDTIDRVACKEPDYNMYLQKGAGDFISHRLRKRAGINLNDQSLNQRLAKIGSITDTLATVDLSSASDSLTHSLVWLILPRDWYEYLNAIRVDETLIDGERHALRMFSSMGNGFTFELETLIFWAICSATVELCHLGRRHDVKVYGDDIVIPSCAYPVVKRSLNYFGFLVNDDKSFVRGPIRESCGKHYYLGRDITPFYIRKPIKTMIDLIHVLNLLREWSGLDSTWCDDSTYWIWSRYSKFVDRRFHGGHDMNDTSRLVTHSSKGGYRLAAKRRTVTGCPDGDYLHWLHDSERRTKLSERETTHVVELRAYVSRRVSDIVRRDYPIWDRELVV